MDSQEAIVSEETKTLPTHMEAADVAELQRVNGEAERARDVLGALRLQMEQAAQALQTAAQAAQVTAAKMTAKYALGDQWSVDPATRAILRGPVPPVPPAAPAGPNRHTRRAGARQKR